MFRVEGLGFRVFFVFLLSLIVTPDGDSSKHTRAQSMKPCRGDKVRTCDNLMAGISSIGILNQGVVVLWRCMEEGNHSIP